MSAYYDTYDYTSYWDSRLYEHLSEISAIKAFLNQIPRVDTILEIGAGFGRLTPAYIFRAKKIVLSDPSAGILKIARRKYQNDKKVKFLHAGVESLDTKLRPSSADLVIMVRVLHHLTDPATAFQKIARILTPNGYLILEFANKVHFKSIFKEFTKGNLTYPLEIYTKDARSKLQIKRKTIPFQNFHPDFIKERLQDAGFEILEVRSVSNIRSPLLKRMLPIETLIYLEKRLQTTLSKICFGPSLFIFARKRV